jgi:rhodanese-related sulfurtransferase
MDIQRFVNIGLVALLLIAVGYFLMMRRGDIDATQARQLVQQGARLVDVRSPAEFAAGHIPGAVNIPVQELEQRLRELEPKQEPIVLYCRSGNRSSRAAGVLKSAGFSEVHDLGAMSRW